jgi:hypothetical protein
MERVCHDDYDINITYGKTYEVLTIYNHLFKVVNDQGEEEYFGEESFSTKQEFRVIQLNKLLNDD